LLERGRSATIKDVVEAIDGPISLNTCLAPGVVCERALWCPTHPVWVQAQRAMLDVLERKSVGELARELTPPRLEVIQKIEPATEFVPMRAVAVENP
jgi:DNA-binding IscR family transcriptional regulator